MNTLNLEIGIQTETGSVIANTVTDSERAVINVLKAAEKLGNGYINFYEGNQYIGSYQLLTDDSAEVL